MGSWMGGWGQARAAAEAESFRITKVKAMDGAVNAEMFKDVDFKRRRPERPAVAAGANGSALLDDVVD